MAYTQGSDILAADYNNFINGTNQLNTVWSTGSGDAGYGQAAVGAVSTELDVSASQWSSLITTLNSARTHQSGSGSGISTVTAGQDINIISTLATSINTAYSSRASFFAQGTTLTGTSLVSYANVAAGGTYNAYAVTRTVTFSSGNAARYFFNAGGQLNFIIPSVTILTANPRATAVQTLVATNIGGLTAFRNTTTGGRTGTGGTLVTNNTTQGYRNLSTADILFANVVSTTASYTTNRGNINVRSNGVQGANGDTGSVLTFTLGLLLPETDAINNAINMGINHRIDVVPPSTTNISNSWGTITIA
jgi:hypothetical protein